MSAVNWGGETRIANDGEWFAGTNIAFRTQEILDCGGFEISLGRNGGGSVLLSNEELKLLDQLKAKGKLLGPKTTTGPIGPSIERIPAAVSITGFRHESLRAG